LSGPSRLGGLPLVADERARRSLASRENPVASDRHHMSGLIRFAIGRRCLRFGAFDFYTYDVVRAVEIPSESVEIVKWTTPRLNGRRIGVDQIAGAAWATATSLISFAGRSTTSAVNCQNDSRPRPPSMLSRRSRRAGGAPPSLRG
jgi:hypothetical protein